MRDIEPEQLDAWTSALDRNLALWIDCMSTSGVITDENDKPVGLALWRFEDAVATLIAIHVEPAHRRTGLGGRLLSAFLAAAHSSGLETAGLGVHETNAGAERLYVDHGFRHVSTQNGYRFFERALG